VNYSGYILSFEKNLFL